MVLKRIPAWLALLAGLSGCAVAPPGQLPNCKLSVREWDAARAALGPIVLRPEDIASVTAFDAGVPGQSGWQVRLTDAGATANRKYSSAHLGGTIAILCDGKEVSRPTIQGESGDAFVFTTGAP